MQATRREILDILKRRAGATVDELARSLELSPMCIRQHLALLERDGLVSPREVRRRTGRPHYFYTLTDKSDEHFPKSYDRLASAILSELKNSDGPERTTALLRNMGARLGDQYAEQLAGRSFEERLSVVVGLLNNGSGLGEWQRVDEGYVLREFDCPYRKVAVEHPEVCDLHAEILVRALDVEVERPENQARGDVRCSYRVRPKSPA
ncbi:MAG: helix-turn-helix transcriptional regulator [Chloroflexota bacterium]